MDMQTIIYSLFLAGAVYGGIRADIKAMHREIANHQTWLTNMQSRFDQHIDHRK